MNAVPRILVIEDEEPLARALRSGLEAEGFAIEVAPDGVSGLAGAMSGDFHVVVLDLMLPGMNGVRVCTRLREAGVTIPILVLTAKQGEWDESEALDIGADDYLRKPFSFSVLVSRIRALLRRTLPAGTPLIEVADLTVDADQRRCWRGTQEIELTPREFALLERLARSNGETLTKRQLLDDVWDFALDDASNIVEVYVGYLRRKIDIPFGCDTIRTVRGVGYRMEAHHD